MTQTTKRLDAADRTVLFYGLLAALLGLGLHFVAIHRYRPWDQPFTMVFLLQLAWLAPLAGALLSGMRSGARWLIALAAYVLVLPLLAAYGLGWDAKNMLAVVSDSQRPMLITFLIGAAGFVLLPLVQELDPRQPQWNYPAVFRAAWRNTVHLALAVCLSISVFVLLWIAGMMFRMIGINTVLDVLGHARFHIAAWPIVLAISLVGVRRRPQIADTLRRSWLTLNAWLLPLVALVGLAFTIALAARMALGFEAVKLSAGALIAFCALWIKLINAAWQDSPGAAPFGQGLSRTLRLAMLCLLPLAAVALYGLGLRVGQYGWTIPRVWALYCGGLLALYALGYAWAALRPAGFYGTLATTNLVAAFATLVLLALVQTPVADPRRIAAQSQLQGLLDGRLEPREYRYSSMRNDHGRWGRDALRQLADGAASKRDPRIAQAAASALTGKYYSWDEPKTDLIAASPTFDTVPAGRQAPDGWWKFLVQQNPYVAQTCATASTTPPATVKQYERDAPCLLLFVDLSGSGQEDLVLFTRVYTADNKYATQGSPQAYRSKTDGGWQHLGRLETPPGAKRASGTETQWALNDGQIRTEAPKERDLIIGDFRLQLR